MRITKNKYLGELTLAAMFLAMGLLLPLATGQLPQVNRFLLPMHIPVFLCALLVGWRYGLCVGAVLPMLRGALFGVPAIYPTAMAMTAELAVYGLVSGIIYGRGEKKRIGRLYISLTVAMVAGRAVRAVTEYILLSLSDKGFAAAAYISGALLPSLVGMVLQLILIPIVVSVVKK